MVNVLSAAYKRKIVVYRVVGESESSYFKVFSVNSSFLISKHAAVYQYKGASFPYSSEALKHSFVAQNSRQDRECG